MACCKSPSAVNYNRKLIFWCAASRQLLCFIIENQDYGVLQVAKCWTHRTQTCALHLNISCQTAHLETQRGTSSKMHAWDMREAIKTYAGSPVHSLCILCPSPAKDQLTKTANLATQRGKSSQKYPGDAPKAIKTYARRPVDSLCKSILDAIIYNQKSILQFLPTSQVL